MAISETEMLIIKNIKNLTDELNEQFIQAAKNDIEIRVDDFEITELGDKAKRILLNVQLFKIL